MKAESTLTILRIDKKPGIVSTKFVSSPKCVLQRLKSDGNKWGFWYKRLSINSGNVFAGILWCQKPYLNHDRFVKRMEKWIILVNLPFLYCRVEKKSSKCLKNVKNASKTSHANVSKTRTLEHMFLCLQEFTYSLSFSHTLSSSSSAIDAKFIKVESD